MSSERLRKKMNLGGSEVPIPSHSPGGRVAPMTSKSTSLRVRGCHAVNTTYLPPSVFVDSSGGKRAVFFLFFAEAPW